MKRSIICCFILILHLILPASLFAQTTADWYMAGANPQRTSWVDVDASNVRNIVWYRPIEAYIDQKTQIIGGSQYNHIYVVTTKGLITLSAETGDLAWRFDTALPLGHTPTVIGDRIYIGGFDHRMYALDDKGSSYELAWQWEGAQAGFSTNPLVIQDSYTTNNKMVFVTGRDGYLYALKDNGTSATLQWKFPNENTPRSSLESIQYSPAYKDGVIYFAAMDMHGYAVDTNGNVKWNSPQKLSGSRFQSWWPVIFNNQVIFSGSIGYKTQTNPGVNSVTLNCTTPISDYTHHIEAFSLYGCAPTNGYSGARVISDGTQGWPVGDQLLDTQSKDLAVHNHTLESYFQQYPYRQNYIALDLQTGNKSAEQPPFMYHGTKSGNVYPPVINLQKNVLYALNSYFFSSYIPRSRVMGWKTGNNYLLLAGEEFAVDEPIALSGLGSLLSQNLCCDREANLTSGIKFWSYSTTLDGVLPYGTDSQAYDPMWGFIDGGLDRLGGYYKANTNSHSGVYHNHGNQNPLVPFTFNGKTWLFSHQSNAIIAFENSPSSPQYKNLVTVNSSSLAENSETSTSLIQKLEFEVDKIVSIYEQNPASGLLNPLYFNDGIPSRNVSKFYFERPDDLIYVLSQAYFHLSDQLLKDRLKAYLDTVYITYFQNFNPTTTNAQNLGWIQGHPRELMEYPPEVANSMQTFRYNVDWKKWHASLNNFGIKPQGLYGLAEYAKVNPQKAVELYNKFRPYINLDLMIPYDRSFPWLYQSDLMGLIGFQKLQQLALQQDPNITLNPSPAVLNAKIAEMQNTFASNFEIEHPFYGAIDNPTGISGKPYDRRMNLSRNFMYLVPEIATYLKQNQPLSIQAAQLYPYLGPFWFESANDNTFQEGVMHHLWDSSTLFRAKAWILDESQEELSQWIDIPTATVGDLFYIQNIVIALEAPVSGSPTPTGTTLPGDTDGDNDVDIFDYNTVISRFGQSVSGAAQGDLDGDSDVDIFDYNLVISNFGK